MTPDEARALKAQLFGRPGDPNSGEHDFKQKYLQNDPAALKTAREIVLVLAGEAEEIERWQVATPSDDAHLRAAVADARERRAALLASPEDRRAYLDGSNKLLVNEVDRLTTLIGQSLDGLLP